jgi:hypothetical protein
MTVTRAISKRQARFSPYRHEPFGLKVLPTACRLDEAREISPFDLEHCLADLVEHRFQQAAIDFRIKVPAEVIEAVFSSAERGRPPARLILALRCPMTRLKRTVVVADAPIAAGAYDVTVSLERDQLRGSLEIVPFLIRTESDPSLEPGYARVAGAQVASSRPWEVRIDILRPPAGQYLEVEYVSFKKYPLRFPHPGNLYKLESDVAAPTLTLNADHPHIAEVLNSKGHIGTRARIREVLFDSISLAVWPRLFLKAASDIRDSDEVPYEWEEAVLDQFLPLLYPQHKRRDAQLDALRDELENGALSMVMDRLDEALQHRLKIADNATKLITDGAKRLEGGD